MKRFGLLPETFDPAKENLDPFAMDQVYWRSLWPQAQRPALNGIASTRER